MSHGPSPDGHVGGKWAEAAVGEAGGEDVTGGGEGSLPEVPAFITTTLGGVDYRDIWGGEET